MNKLSVKPWFLILVMAQVICATVATITDVFVFKIGVATLGSIILLIAYSKKLTRVFDIWVVILAFVCSIIGDYFLSLMNGDTAMFMIGIALYLMAHIGYLIFSLLNGKIRWRSTIFITLAFLSFFYFTLFPKITDKTLVLTVLFYLIVSCVSLGASLGIKARPAVKWPYVIGIGLILISDTIISFKEFVKYDSFNYLILPTYYLAQIAITIALYNKNKTYLKEG